MEEKQLIISDFNHHCGLRKYPFQNPSSFLCILTEGEEYLDHDVFLSVSPGDNRNRWWDNMRLSHTVSQDSHQQAVEDSHGLSTCSPPSIRVPACPAGAPAWQLSPCNEVSGTEAPGSVTVTF